MKQQWFFHYSLHACGLLPQITVIPMMWLHNFTAACHRPRPNGSIFCHMLELTTAQVYRIDFWYFIQLALIGVLYYDFWDLFLMYIKLYVIILFRKWWPFCKQHFHVYSWIETLEFWKNFIDIFLGVWLVVSPVLVVIIFWWHQAAEHQLNQG